MPSKTFDASCTCRWHVAAGSRSACAVSAS